NDDPVCSFVGGIGNVSDAFITASKIEADVVEVSRRKRDIAWKRNRPDNLVCFKVDANELRAAELGRLEHRAAGVEYPQPILWINDHGLNRNECFGIRVRARLVVLFTRVCDRFAAGY